MQDQQAEKEAEMQQQQEMMMMQQAPQLLKTPMADPTKNPNAEEMISEALAPPES